MKNFKEWLLDNELNERNMGWLGAGAMALASMFPSTAKAQDPTHHLSGEQLVDMGQSYKKLESDERFIKSWTILKENLTTELKAKPYIKNLLIDIVTEDYQGKKIAVVSITADIQAPDQEHAKKILIYEIMKASGKVGLQGEAIKGLRKIFQNENVEQLFRLKLLITPTGASWSNF